MTPCAMQKDINSHQIHDSNTYCVIITLNLDSTMVKVVWSQKSVLKSHFSLSHSTLHYAPCTMHHAPCMATFRVREPASHPLPGRVSSNGCQPHPTFLQYQTYYTDRSQPTISSNCINFTYLFIIIST